MINTKLSKIRQENSSKHAVYVRGLLKQYRNKTKALGNVNLDVSNGELFGLVGPDGAGKTTLLNILAGVMPASAGDIRVFGEHPESARHQISYVPQGCALYPELTVEEHLQYEAGLRGLSYKALEEKNYLEEFGLSAFSHRLAGKLSGGMKQKLALCCALISSPTLLLLDEPTNGLDPISRRELWQLLVLLTKAGVTIVVSTSSLEEAEQCSRLALMYEGTIHDTGSPQELKRSLGMRRLEITIPQEDCANEALLELCAYRSANIEDIYILGTHMEVLCTNVSSAKQELGMKLQSLNIDIRVGQETLPTIENLVLTKLRRLKAVNSLPITFPHLLESKEAKRTDRLNDAAISVIKLNKKFGDFSAVRDLELEIKYGEIFGLLGANGAGKTSTIKMLCGLMTPTSGQLTIATENTYLRSRQIRKRIGYMSQKFTLYDELSVKENLEFYASIYEIPYKLRKRQMGWVIETFGLGEILDLAITHLPLGWKQRIAFGAAVMHEPDILFLDEPTAGIDPLARRHLWMYIRDFAKNGAAILVTTHYLDEAEYCHRLAFMSAGRIIRQGAPSELKQDTRSKLFEIKATPLDKALQALNNYLENWRIVAFANSLRLFLDNPEVQIPLIKERLQKGGCEGILLTPVRFSLEDAFIDSVLNDTRSL